MNYSVSDTAEYGGMTRGTRVITEQTKNDMKNILLEVQNGNFAKEWIKENADGQPKLNELRDKNKNHQIEKVGSELRKMMTWVLEANIK